MLGIVNLFKNCSGGKKLRELVEKFFWQKIWATVRSVWLWGNNDNSNSDGNDNTYFEHLCQQN